jgi:hypothetical protein
LDLKKSPVAVKFEIPYLTRSHSYDTTLPTLGELKSMYIEERLGSLAGETFMEIYLAV